MKNLIFIFFIFIVPLAQAQNYTLNPGQTELTVDGTSSLHDWTIVAEEFEGKAEIGLEGDNLGNIQNLTFNVPVKSLKSGKSAMDNNTCEALKEQSHPYITYEFTSMEDKTKSGGKTIINTKGKLTIAGVTKTVNMKVTTEVTQDVKFSGSVSFNMTDFNVDPPKAMFGTITTGDKVTINFNAHYTK